MDINTPIHIILVYSLPMYDEIGNLGFDTNVSRLNPLGSAETYSNIYVREPLYSQSLLMRKINKNQISRE